MCDVMTYRPRASAAPRAARAAAVLCARGLEHPSKGPSLFSVMPPEHPEHASITADPQEPLRVAAHGTGPFRAIIGDLPALITADWMSTQSGFESHGGFRLFQEARVGANESYDH